MFWDSNDFNRRAGFWTALLVLSTTLVFYLQQFTDVLPRGRVFEIAGSICMVALFFGIRLTLLVAGVIERIGSDRLSNIVGSLPFTVVGVLLINWLLYFAALYLIARIINRLGLRGKTYH